MITRRTRTAGRQCAWRGRADRDTDWIVVVMHQTAISTADHFNGSDRGVREQWLPLFDSHGVDLVVCGHEHHYERSHPVRGAQANDALTPLPAATDTSTVDTTLGTVHLVIGGGGTSVPSNGLFFDPPAGRVITGVEPVGDNGKRPASYVPESAPFSAVRDRTHPYGFAAFDVDPGTRPGGPTTIAVTYYAVTGPYGELPAVNQVTLVRPRRDGRRWPDAATAGDAVAGQRQRSAWPQSGPATPYTAVPAGSSQQVSAYRPSGVLRVFSRYSAGRRSIT